MDFYRLFVYLYIMRSLDLRHIYTFNAYLTHFDFSNENSFLLSSIYTHRLREMLRCILADKLYIYVCLVRQFLILFLISFSSHDYATSASQIYPPSFPFIYA